MGKKATKKQIEATEEAHRRYMRLNKSRQEAKAAKAKAAKAKEDTKALGNPGEPDNKEMRTIPEAETKPKTKTDTKPPPPKSDTKSDTKAPLFKKDTKADTKPKPDASSALTDKGRLDVAKDNLAYENILLSNEEYEAQVEAMRAQMAAEKAEFDAETAARLEDSRQGIPTKGRWEGEEWVSPEDLAERNRRMFHEDSIADWADEQMVRNRQLHALLALQHRLQTSVVEGFEEEVAAEDQAIKDQWRAESQGVDARRLREDQRKGGQVGEYQPPPPESKSDYYPQTSESGYERERRLQTSPSGYEERRLGTSESVPATPRTRRVWDGNQNRFVTVLAEEVGP